MTTILRHILATMLGFIAILCVPAYWPILLVGLKPSKPTP